MKRIIHAIAASIAPLLLLASAAWAAPEPSALCKASLKSLSRQSGAPGENFDMVGEWDGAQGPRTASINRGNGHLLEVLSWSSSVIKVRIPQGLEPGLYKVGVYCNNPPHYQGSVFLSFIVTEAPAKQQASQQQPQNAASTQPQTQAQAQSQTTGLDQPLIVMREVKPPAASKTAPPVKKLEDSDNNGLWIIVAVVAAVIIFIIRKRSVVRAANYQNAPEIQGQHSGEPAARKSAAIDVPAPFTGQYNGVEYTAEVMGYDMTTGSGKGTPFVTVYIDLQKPLSRTLEVNARKTKPVIKDDRAGHVNALLDMGASYIDVGYNTDWVSAEVPVTKATVTRQMAEQIVDRLIKLRDMSA